jgi:hypothetical protein
MPHRIYYTFNYPILVPGGKTLLTGIRSSGDTYYITGFYEYSNSIQQQISFLYKGPLKGNGTWYQLNYPSAEGRTVTSTSLYGPCILNNDNVRVVGNYTTSEAGTSAFGCMYEGPLDGSGTWITLTPTSEDPVLNTIAHSNMGNLVVGNYDTSLKLGKAFVYDVVTGIYYDIIKKGALSITAYGIWHNGGDLYTICGSYAKIGNPGLTIGYLVDWNNTTHKFSSWREYSYRNDRSIITHFDGITSDGCGGYNLTGDRISHREKKKAGLFANVKRDCHDKLLTEAKWTPISFPEAEITSGNSVDEKIVIGVYTFPSDDSINGFVSVVE